MPEVELEDKDLLNAVQNETGLDMTDMVILKKEIVNNRLRFFYKPSLG